ncbi:unnamed protein product [Acanthoscelides obtectus]|uniref:MADF domain-containing protein n=1 Tax=Acanthoscelides obtectus TaxID=200917 RepID=A0A9P0L524_ACAOB|nr:unnamed protein product [Acanthoscelides obtectus]CAK1656798.1 hypothetical protein AOBTE_LOCUS19921 [Acanthoscelides obtectus]
MDKELLIAAVFERTAIWNKRDKLHSNRNVVDRYWKEISIEIKQDEAKIRKQWKYLRDQFSVELGKLPPPRSGDAAEDLPTSKWPYFTQLLFLKDVIKPRAASGNLSMMQSAQSTQETEEIQSSNENSDNEESSRESEGCVVPPTPISRKTNPTSASITAQRKRRTATDAYQESMLEIEKRKVEYLENKAKRGCSDQDDEHMSFFKSLLPHVRQIPANRILCFRSRVQELVDQFSYQHNTFSHLSSSASSHCSAPSPYNIDQNSCAPSPNYHNIQETTHSSIPLNQPSVMFKSLPATVSRLLDNNQQQNTTYVSLSLPENGIHP